MDGGCSRVCRQWVQVVKECAGSSCRLFQSLQAVPECAGSSRVCRQFVQAVQECVD